MDGKSVSFSLLSRLSLEVMIGAQQGKLNEMYAWRDLLDKIRVENRSAYINELGLNTEALEKAAPLAVALEKEEVRRLESLLRSWDNYHPNDVEWADSLLKQLTA